MIKRLFILGIIFCWHVLSFRVDATCLADTVSRVIDEYNGIRYTLQLHRDSAGYPAFYHAYVFTPVCEDNLCKPVYIDLYWDLIGNYLRYEVPLDKPLTKLDHAPFRPEEYRRFQEILADSASLLKDYQIEELVESTTRAKPGGEVDGITGATAKSLQAVVIPGALYTCYTLWHIVHGRVQDTIAKVTDSLASGPLMAHFLRSGNHRYQHYALDRLLDGQGQIETGFEEDVVGLIGSSNIFLALRVLKEVDPDYLHDANRQRWLGTVFLNANYRLQLALLKKLEGIPITHGLRRTLETHQRDFNEEIATKIKMLLNKKQA